MGSDYMTSRLLSRPQAYSNVQNKGTTDYDDSGQVFTETTCPAGPMTADWVWKTRGSSRQAGRRRSVGPGCSSLVNMAIRSALHNSFNITAESLGELPWEVASLLWQSIIAAQLDSVKVWKAFASAYPHEVDKTLKTKHHIIHNPNMRFIDYVKPTTSHSLNWVTFLTLSNITCSRADLIQISQLVNLGNLTLGPAIQAPDIGLDDSIIRNWARLAAESDAFSILRVLNFRWQREITSRVFTHLNQFPALALFNVEECNLGPQEKPIAQQHGWKYKTGVELRDWLLKGGAKGPSWDSVVQACFRLGGEFSMESLTDEGVRAIDDLPVLHLSIGGATRDALVDVIGGRILRCFYRTTKDQGEKLVRVSNKRLYTEDQPKVPRKKPIMRASKQQNMEDLLMGFGG